MKKILRFIISAETEIPTGAVLLECMPGQTGLSGWFLCDPAADRETRRFALVATGQDLPDGIMDCPHLATFKAVAMIGDAPPAPTALHLFDCTYATPETWKTINTAPMKPQNPTGDSADWWKNGN